MIVLRQKFYSQSSDKSEDDGASKKIKWSDRMDIKAYKKNKKLRELQKDMFSDDPEVRKKAEKKKLRRDLGRYATAVGAGTAIGTGLIYGISKLPESTKNKLDNKLGLKTKNITKEEINSSIKKVIPQAVLTSGAEVAVRKISEKKRSKRIEEGNLNNNDKKTLDQIKVADGSMTEEEYANRWGRSRRKK